MEDAHDCACSHRARRRESIRRVILVIGRYSTAPRNTTCCRTLILLAPAKPEATSDAAPLIPHQKRNEPPTRDRGSFRGVGDVRRQARTTEVRERRDQQRQSRNGSHHPPRGGGQHRAGGILTPQRLKSNGCCADARVPDPGLLKPVAPPVSDSGSAERFCHGNNHLDFASGGLAIRAG